MNDRPCFVYFILGADKLKIGSTRNPAQRFKDLQSASPVPLRLLGTIPRGYHFELILHDKFASLRSHGEWFQAGEELLAEVQRLLHFQYLARPKVSHAPA